MEKTTQEQQLKDGIYKSENAVYFIKGGKIVMRLMGSYYKTTDNFLVGARYVEPFNMTQEEFDAQYDKLKSW